MITTNLGTYSTLDEVWESHPTGGIEGTYVYIGETIYVWDKYLSNWRMANEEDLQEGVVATSTDTEDNISGYNYYGEFSSIEEVWSAYPQGGIEGSYVKVNGINYIWDKYLGDWREATETDQIKPIEEAGALDTTTYKLIICLGRFESLEKVWEAYPHGGIEGAYVYIGEDKYRWNKYISNWAIASAIDSSLIKPIVVLSRDGVVEYSDNYINYLGTFDTIDEVWLVYPEGGRDGDYVIVAGEKLKWNKYANDWGDTQEDDTSQLRAVASIYGDLHVYNDLIVGEDLIAAIIEKLATRIALSKLRPMRVESEEIMEQMIASGEYDPEQIYYVPETA